MSAITVTNKENSIMGDVDTALTDATISGAAVFNSVTATTSEAQATQAQFKGTPPLAIIRYLSTTEDTAPDDQRNCVLSLELIIATKVDSGVDETARLTEILRLMNAAKNAIETDAPSDASANGDADFYHDQIIWGTPDLDVTEHAPWAICRLPVEFGFILDAQTSH